MKILPTLIVGVLLVTHRGLTATVTVTSLSDNGPGTLRDAIAAAAPNDTVNFGVTGTIILTNGELLINKNLTIDGPGPNLLTVQRSTAAGTAEFRIFNVTAGAVAISSLAVNNGRAPMGGGILNDDVLTLSNCVVIGNVATNLTDEAKGGGIKNSRTGTLTVRQSIISSNAATGGAFVGSGGALYNENTMAMTDSSVHGNIASGGEGARGGGMVNGFSASVTNSSFRFNSAIGDSGATGQMGTGGGILNLGTLFLKDCTVSDNTTIGGAGTGGDGGSVHGGGIANGIGTTIELQRCTVSGNTATGGDSLSGTGGSSQGGGIAGEFGSTISMTNSTISGNGVKAGTGGTSFSVGGGVFADASTVTTFHSTVTRNTVLNGSATDGGGICLSNGSTVEIKNTILAANNAMVDLFLDDTSSYDSSGFNLIGATNGMVTPSGPSDQFNVSGAALNLGPLQNNGGPTLTHALLCGSVAIDAGNNSGAPPTDQRGSPRIVNGTIDIGAFEASTSSGGGAALLVLTKSCPADPPAPGELLVFSGTLRNAGSVAVTNIVIVNNQPAAGTPVTNFDRLDPGQSTNFSGAYRVPDNYTNCFILDTLTASAVDTCSGAPITTNATATCPIAHILAITCPANATVQCPADVPPPAPNSIVATSSAGAVTVKHMGDGAMTNGCMISISRLYVATDACGNMVACAQMIKIQDTTPPTITCPSLLMVPADFDQCSKTNVTYPITASDNCSTVSTDCSPPNGSTFPVGDTTVHCVATDACGNTNSCSFTVMVADTQPPTLMCPPGIAPGVDSGQSSKSNVTYMAMAIDNCPGVSVSCTPPSGSTFPMGTNTVTCTATDAASNTVTCQFNVIVGTNEPPTIQCPPDIVAGTDAGQCSKSNVMFVVTALNSSPGIVVTCNFPSGSTFPTGTNTVTCMATDAAGLTNQCSFQIIINDTEMPVLTCPLDVVAIADLGQCSKTNVIYDITATDNCPGVTATCIPPSGSTFPVGTNTVLCTATDAAGNATQCSFLLVINETEPPMIFCPTDVVAAIDPGQSSRSNVTYSVTATDNCPGVSVTCVPPSGSTFPKGTNIVTCTATDAAGNTTTCNFSVIIQDSEAAVIQCPADILTSTDPGQCSKSNLTYVVMATDNDPGVSVTCDSPSGSTFPKGTNKVTCTATDATGLTTQCSFLIAVQDTEPPTLACPTDILVNADPNQCSKSNVIYLVVGSDNCPGVIVSCTPSNGSAFVIGTNSVACTATDDSGQTTSCSFRVIVQTIPVTISFDVNTDCPTNLLPPLSLQASSMICLQAADNAPSSFYRAALSNVPPGFVVQNGFYQGWCVDYAGGLTTNEVYKPAFLYLSHGPLPPQLENTNWDKVNYILNHKQGDSFDVQAAIWHFIGGPIPDIDARFTPLSSFATNIIADADAHGAGFVPGPGQISAVILDLGTDAQTNIIEVVCPRGLQLCVGTNFTLCATATGSGPLTFQWAKDGVPIQGTTSNCLTLTNVSSADAGQYCLEVTSACNNSATACVTVGVVDCGPSPIPRLMALSVLKQDVEIKVDGEPHGRYIIEASSDLVHWRRITTAEYSNGSLRFEDPDAGSKCFYRVLLEP